MMTLNIIIIFLLAIFVSFYQFKKIKNLQHHNNQLQQQIDRLINDHKEGIHEFCNELSDLREKLKAAIQINQNLNSDIKEYELMLKQLNNELAASELQYKQFSQSSMKMIARYNELKEHYQFLISNMKLPEDLKIQVPKEDEHDIKEAVNA